MKFPWYLESLDAEAAFSCSWLTVDMETTNLDKGSPLNKENRLVLISYKHSAARHVTTTYADDADGLRKFTEAVASARVLNCHNNKFELGWLSRIGINTDHLFNIDTLVLEYVLAGNRKWALDLDSVGRRYGLGGKDPVIDSLMRGGVCPSQMPASRLFRRVELDVRTTDKLARLQIKRLRALRLLPVAFTRCITTPVLAAMEPQGMCLDSEAVTAEYNATSQALAAEEQKLAQLSGGINLGSGKQVAELLYDKLLFAEPTKRNGDPDRTKSGKRKTDSATLESLVATTPEQKQFVEARKAWGKLNARITKSLEFFKHVCEEKDAIFYGQFNQCVTQTHRLSASGRRLTFSDGYEGGAQFQNLPREYKKLFTTSNRQTKPGMDGGDFVLVETDGSGLEFRVAAFLGADPIAVADIRSGTDVHRYTAAVLCNKPEEKITKDERQNAKAETFKPLYGGEYGTKAQMRYYAAFREKYKGITDTQNAWATDVLKTKQLRTPSGLILYWPFAKPDSRDGRLDGGSRRQVYNYPIQGFATADIIPVALTYVHHGVAAAGLRARLINTVHDSIIAEVHKDDVDDYLAIVEAAFLGQTYRYLESVFGIDFSCPLGVGITIGTHWGVGEERKISYGKEDARCLK